MKNNTAQKKTHVMGTSENVTVILDINDHTAVIKRNVRYTDRMYRKVVSKPLRSMFLCCSSCSFFFFNFPMEDLSRGFSI